MSAVQDKKKTAGIVSNVQELLGSLLGRMQAGSTLGMSYGPDNNDRDLYRVLGYRKILSFQNYYDYYKRDPIAKVLIKKLPEAVWKSEPQISEMSDSEENTALEKEYRDLEKRLKINNKCLRLDKMLGLGQYAVLLIGFNDSIDFSIPVIKTDKLDVNYIFPYSESSVSIVTFDTNKLSVRYGLPEYYDIKIGGLISSTQDAVSSSESIRVHHSRVIHVVKNKLESDVYGDPDLEEVYNNIQNIEKIGGGSAEMFWRGARPGFVAKAQKDAHINSLGAADMQNQFDEFDHNLRRWLTLQGVDVQELSPQVVSPKDHLDVQLELICIAKGIPKRILLGSERGELASSQDVNTWNELVYQTMTHHAEPNILRPLIDKFIEYGILPTPAKGEYDVEWPELSVIGEKERADINYTKTKSIAEYVKAPGADMLLPEPVFLSKLLQFNDDELEEIQEYRDKFIQEEKEFEEELERQGLNQENDDLNRVEEE